MAVKFKHSDEYSMYYITCTCFKWLKLFEVTDGYDCVYNWFEYLKSKNIDTIGFALMPNHLHLIVHFRETKFDLNKVVSNAKRFMAYELVKRLEHMGRKDLLLLLQESLTERERTNGQKHRVFEKSFDAKPIYSQPFLMQKLEYIHLNPVRGKWRLVDDFRDYHHSSASYYELGIVKLFEPVHYKSL